MSKNITSILRKASQTAAQIADLLNSLLENPESSRSKPKEEKTSTRSSKSKATENEAPVKKTKSTKSSAPVKEEPVPKKTNKKAPRKTTEDDDFPGML